MNKPIIIILFFVSLQSFGQLKLTGQVSDLKNNPLANVSVSIVGLNASGITDDSGVFFLTLPSSIKKGDIITLRASRDEYKAINKHIAVTALSIPIKLLRDPQFRKIADHDKIVPPPTNSQPSIQTNVTTEAQNQPANVTSYFQSGGVTANQVYLGRPARILNAHPTAEDQLLAFLTDKNEKVTITCILNDKEAFDFANQIKDFLKSKSYTNVGDVGQAMIFPSGGGVLQPQSFNRDKNGVFITIGSNQ